MNKKRKKHICKCDSPTKYNPYIKETHCIKCGGWIISETLKTSMMCRIDEIFKYIVRG